MQSFENIQLNLTPGRETAALTDAYASPPPSAEGQREISREVAHELNNVLTIIRGYSERLLMKNTGNAALLADLKLISDSARRAELVIRQAARGQRQLTPR